MTKKSGVMDPGVALKLAQSSDNELIVSNALLFLANKSSADKDIASSCLSILKPLLAHRSRVAPHRDTLVRLAGCCTCFGLDTTAMEAELTQILLEGVGSQDPKVRYFAILGLGNLCCDSRHARDAIASDAGLLAKLFAIEPKENNLFGLLVNVSVDHQSEALALAVVDQAPFNSNAGTRQRIYSTLNFWWQDDFR